MLATGRVQLGGVARRLVPLLLLSFLLYCPPAPALAETGDAGAKAPPKTSDDPILDMDADEPGQRFFGETFAGAELPDFPAKVADVRKVAFAMVVVFGGLVAAFLLIRRYMTGRYGLLGRERWIRVLASSYLGPRKTISIVEVAGQVLVLAISHNDVRLLTRIEDPDVVARITSERSAKRKPSPAFAEQLRRAGLGGSPRTAPDRAEEPAPAGESPDAARVARSIREKMGRWQDL